MLNIIQAVDSLGSVNCKSTEMAVVNKTHFCELKVGKITCIIVF
jgi:hypothetical protein